ncbi:NADPH-dependent FMN reductase [Bacillaceae bacterium S4-13-58]
MKLVGLSGAIMGSKTAILVDEVIKRSEKLGADIEVELIDMKDYKVEIIDGRPSDQYNDDTKTIIKKIVDADFFVVGAPIYQASIPGVLKNLFDHLPMSVFESKVVAMVTNGGTERHALVAENQLKPILSFFKAIVCPTSVFVTSGAFNDKNEIVDENVSERLDRLAEELVFLQTKLSN